MEYRASTLPKGSWEMKGRQDIKLQKFRQGWLMMRRLVLAARGDCDVVWL